MGGAGLAFPACICRVKVCLSFFATVFFSFRRCSLKKQLRVVLAGDYWGHPPTSIARFAGLGLTLSQPVKSRAQQASHARRSSPSPVLSLFPCRSPPPCRGS